MTREQVWQDLWKDPKYLRLQKAKDLAGKRWNVANARKDPAEEKLSRAFANAVNALTKYEDAALSKASVGGKKR